MTSYMKYYETLYLIRPDLEVEDYKGVIEKYHKIIEANNGVIINVDEWGKRSLAYNVERFRDGFYVLVRFCGEPDLPDKLLKDFRLDESVLKYIVVKLKDSVDPEELKQGDTSSASEANKKEEVKAKDGSK
ncbi:MAG: 30S ribosomal protein S6 [Deltaproteobacteria bacterium]|nr:MAG: 30S ribosomal protein S6 [Deltaproteobacteria bacterium]